MSRFQMSQSRSSGGKSKDKSFSSKGKIEKYNHDGTETIIVMGRPFRVLQKIGEGPSHTAGYHERTRHSKDTRSFVFLVENTENLQEFPRHLALKRSFFNVDEVLIAHREPEVLGRIKDKGIVKVFHTEVTRSDGKLGVTVAMEYCSSNLYRRLRQETRLSEGEIVQVLLAITSAVGYLHTRQPPVAHRDICPDNILIHSGASGAAAYRLCNFASAATEAYECGSREEIQMAASDIERHTRPGFRAPEMADPGSRTRIDERVDNWSIGVLLYYMMYQRLPFGETNMGLTGRIKLKFPAGTETWYSGSLRVVLQHLLEPDPEKRWDIFALTNFLRFDEDISRHIGTFFFTATEWPDGWEQQEVKVINRPTPPKAPPIRVEGSKPAPTNNNNINNEVSQTKAHSPRQFELDAATLEALGVDPHSTDPEMIAYREMIIKEQEEAWRLATQGQQQRQQGNTNINSATARTTVQQQSTEQYKVEEEKRRREEEEEEEKKKQEAKKNDLFDDLFDATPVLAPTQLVATETNNWQDSLFSSAPPLSTAPTVFPQQREHHGNPMMMMNNNNYNNNNNFNFNDDWGTGAPTMAPVGYGMGGMYSAPQQIQSFQQQESQQPPVIQKQTSQQSFQQIQQQFQQQVQQQKQQEQIQQQQQQPKQTSSSWSNSGSFVQSQPHSQLQSPQIQQQQQQATFDITQGNFSEPPATATTTTTTEVKPEKKKDPFEDLFS